MTAVAARLRILHTEASLGWGGQEIRVLTEARGVRRLGHEVVLAAPPESRIFAEARHFGVETLALPIGAKRLRGLWALRRLLAHRPFDVVNTHSSTDAWLAAIACTTLGRAPPTVRTRHISAPLPSNGATRWLYARASARVVTTGERLRQQVMREAAIDGARVVSIPTGIDLARFRPGNRDAMRSALGLDAAAPLIGIVATLRSWKGHRYLLEALAAMTRKDPVVVIVGDGPQRAALETLAAAPGLAGRVVFAGNQADVAPWLQALDIFCLPSYANEGVPQSLMQAMACGLPVVTTPVGSIEEIVSDGDTGVLVPPEDAARLREAIERLLPDAGLRAALGRRAAQVARERFGEEHMVERMVAVFREVAAAHG
ncbi:MAG: glycosyltransferase family 4 protein [Usitatibacter sp.]